MLILKGGMFGWKSMIDEGINYSNADRFWVTAIFSSSGTGGINYSNADRFWRTLSGFPKKPVSVRQVLTAFFP